MALRLSLLERGKVESQDYAGRTKHLVFDNAPMILLVTATPTFIVGPVVFSNTDGEVVYSNCRTQDKIILLTSCQVHAAAIYMKAFVSGPRCPMQLIANVQSTTSRDIRHSET